MAVAPLVVEKTTASVSGRHASELGASRPTADEVDHGLAVDVDAAAAPTSPNSKLRRNASATGSQPGVTSPSM